MLVELIKKGIAGTGLGYDGKPYFALDHSEGKSGVHANLSGDMLTASNVAKWRANMRKIKNDQGRQLGRPSDDKHSQSNLFRYEPSTKDARPT